MGHSHPLICLFSFFSNTNFTETSVGFSGIRTRIVRVEGEHADHLTATTMALYCKTLCQLLMAVLVLKIKRLWVHSLRFFRYEFAPRLILILES